MWYNATVDHNTNHGLDSPNRFNVSRLIKPPQLYHLPGNKFQTWETHNHLIDAINNGIKRFNASIQEFHGDIMTGRRSTVVGLAGLGIRTNKAGLKEHRVDSGGNGKPRESCTLETPSKQSPWECASLSSNPRRQTLQTNTIRKSSLIYKFIHG